VSGANAYHVACYNCRASFDALEATFCSCLVTERSLVCPHCLQCFCKGALGYKQRFWREAPKALWDRKFLEHSPDYTPPPNPEPGDVERPLVLVVDDEKDILRVASRVIQGLGYGLILAPDGEVGLELAKRYRPDLVLADALMPKLDGREMGLRIKNDPQTAGVKVVVMTSLYTNVKYQNEGYRVFKVDDYLTKPLEFSQLQAVLQKHLG
jgi:CheY-like chemotaxis protein